MLLALSPHLAPAQSTSASFAMPRQSIDGGAGRAASATYSVEGTIGQPDGGPVMNSASFTLSGGFHRAAAVEALPDAVFSDGFEVP